jgi:hypothetical protein
MLIALQHRVGAKLPEHQVGVLGGDGLVEVRQHVDGARAGNAAVEHHDGLGREALTEFIHEAAGVGGRGRASPRAGGRG